MLFVVLRRVAEGVLALLGIAIAVFFLLHLDNINPARAMLGRLATPAKVAALTAALGLNQPVPIQFVLWLKALLLEGQLHDILATNLGPTLELLVFGALAAFWGSVLLATVQIRWRGSWLDRGLSVLTYLLNAIPPFWLANALLFLLAIVVLWLPPTGSPTYGQTGLGQWAFHLILPVGTLALSLVGSWTRYLRASLDDAMESHYVRTARALGFPETRIVRRHALRNSLLPLITLVGMAMPTVLNAVIVIEMVFAMNGLGAQFLGALYALSFGTATEYALVLAIVTVLGNILADVAYVMADPRIRYA
jgi:peptide/nickel transport system permease protein